MNVADIKRWLDHSDSVYIDGESLYKFYGRNQELKKLFSSGESIVTRKILRKKLAQLWEELKDARIIQMRDPLPLPSNAKPTTEDFELLSESKTIKIDAEALPIELKKKWVHKGTLFKEASFWMNRLALIETDEERFNAAKIIVSNMRTIAGYWKEFEHWQKNKQLLKKETGNLPENELEIYQELHRLPSRISKAKRKNRPEEVAALEERKKLLKLKLKEVQGG